MLDNTHREKVIQDEAGEGVEARSCHCTQEGGFSSEFHGTSLEGVIQGNVMT